MRGGGLVAAAVLPCWRMGLTDRQQVFGRLCVQGMPPAEAYKQAYGRGDMAVEAVRKVAWRLAQKQEVKDYMDALRRAAEMGAVLDRQRRMVLLSRGALACFDAGDVADMVRCIAELNRMDGTYVPERQEVSIVGDFAALMGELARNGGVALQGLMAGAACAGVLPNGRVGGRGWAMRNPPVMGCNPRRAYKTQ